MFAKKMLRIGSLVASAVLVGVVGMAVLMPKQVDAGNLNGDIYFGVNTLTGEEEQFIVEKTSTGYSFNGYMGNHVASKELGIPLEYSTQPNGGGVTIQINAISKEACKEYTITKVSIPEGVESIGKEAFKNCTGIVEVSFPSSLKKLGDSSFENCALLKYLDMSELDELDINQGGVHIVNKGNSDGLGKNAFKDCKALIEAKLPASAPKFQFVTEGMFDGCVRLTKVVIPDSVTEIDVNAFRGDILLENVSFGSNLVYIDKSSFANCTGLTYIQIPNSVRFFGENSFDSCSKLATVTFSEGSMLETVDKYAFANTKLSKFETPVTAKNFYSIKEGAFMNCKSLSKVIIKSGSVGTFDKRAFYNCVELTSVDISEELTGIGEECFMNCRLLGNISTRKDNLLKNVINIGRAAFSGCESFTEFVIPDVETIGDHTFYGCRRIEKVYFDGTLLAKIGDYAFAGCDKLVIENGAKLPANITEVGDSVFESCKSLKKIILPNGLVKLGKACFKDCTILVSVNIPGTIDTLYDAVFQNCASLRSITIPDACVEIPDKAFAGCTSLKTVNMGGDIKKIGDEAFKDCNSLGHDDGNLDLGANLIILGKSAFANCKEIKSVRIPDGITEIPQSCFDGCVLLKTVDLNKVTSIMDNGFNKCESLQEISFPTGFNKFSRNSFSGCKSLTYVVIPDTVFEIPQSCFSNCTSLEYVSIPDSVTILGNFAFGSCNIKAIEIPEETLDYNRAFSGNKELHRVRINGSTAEIVKYYGSNQNVEVPQNVYGATVTSIAADAYRNTTIKQLHVPSSVKKIGTQAFANCENLLTVRIPNGTSYPSNAFDGCVETYRIEDVDDKSVKIVNFYGSGSKTDNSLKIPDRLEGKTVVSIGFSAFAGNKDLKSVTVPKVITEIGASAFKGCSNADISYPVQATVGDQAFSGTKSATPYGTVPPTATPKVTVTPTPKPGQPTPAASGDFGDFVERLYTVAMNRKSDKGGKEYWTNEIKSGKKTGGDCAEYFLLTAPEFMNRGLNNDKFVETLYQTFFGRASEAAGKKYWLGRLTSGTSRTDVVKSFIDSKEWCNICAGYGVKSGAPTAKAEKASENAKGFATRLYTCCLGRQTDAQGLKYWSLALTNLEKTGYDAAKFFFDSEEFKGFNTSNSEFVRRLYTTFMDREPEAKGFDFWVSQLNQGKMDRMAVLASFAQSQEFTNICKKYGIDRGSI
ncbi:MAG: leucine-rich repeat protein [Clostridiales bacterium]|nr:leucine-rich repeat protein [Clostridiales bacterium]